MADNDIIDADWEEVPENAQGKLQRRRELGERDINPDEPSPWIEPTFWASLSGSLRRGLTAVAAIVVVFFIANLVAEDQSTKTTQSPAIAEATAGTNSATEAEEIPSPQPVLVGDWVQAEHGGEDGRTKCNDAEIMTTMNGGSTDVLHVYRNGKIRYELWYDTAFEERGEPEVKAAYNTGVWTLDGDELHVSWQGGNTGLFGSDLAPSEVNARVALDGNIMTYSSDGGIMRFVRCV